MISQIVPDLRSIKVSNLSHFVPNLALFATKSDITGNEVRDIRFEPLVG